MSQVSREQVVALSVPPPKSGQLFQKYVFSGPLALVQLPAINPVPLVAPDGVLAPALRPYTAPLPTGRCWK